VAKGFGAGRPLRLALEYGFICDSFLESLTPEEKILIDNQILNDLIKQENDANEKASKEAKEKSEHPGMERYESEDDFWDEVAKAEKEKSQNKDMEAQ
jgi:hypothetical protein